MRCLKWWVVVASIGLCATGCGETIVQPFVDGTDGAVDFPDADVADAGGNDEPDDGDDDLDDDDAIEPDDDN